MSLCHHDFRLATSNSVTITVCSKCGKFGETLPAASASKYAVGSSGATGDGAQFNGDMYAPTMGPRAVFAPIKAGQSVSNILVSTADDARISQIQGNNNNVNQSSSVNSFFIVVEDLRKKVLHSLEGQPEAKLNPTEKGWYVDDVLHVAQAICKVQWDKVQGTGFLSDKNQILTCFHNFLNESERKKGVEDDEVLRRVGDAVFTFQLANRQVRADKVLAWSPYRNQSGAVENFLDFVLVSVHGEPVSRGIELWDFKATTLDVINIVSHPGTDQQGVSMPKGDDLRIDFRCNSVRSCGSFHFEYTTNAEPGTSGAPVFNDNWEILGIHRWGITDIGNQAVRILPILNRISSQVSSIEKLRFDETQIRVRIRLVRDGLFWKTAVCYAGSRLSELRDRCNIDASWIFVILRKGEKQPVPADDGETVEKCVTEAKILHLRSVIQ